MKKTIPSIEDPWVTEFNLLIKELKSIGIPDNLLNGKSINWYEVRNNIKHYCRDVLRYKKIITLLDRVRKGR